MPVKRTDTPIEWATLAHDLGALQEGNPRSESGGDGLARAALEILIGEKHIVDAVEYYISGQPGAELARSVLRYLHPWSAMEYCYRVFRSDEDAERRRSAVELLRVVADARGLKWVPEFMADEDEAVQNWGIGMLDQLLFTNCIEIDECSEMLKVALEHPNAHVRQAANRIRLDRQNERAG